MTLHTPIPSVDYWASVLSDYAAGNLTPAKHIMVACKREISPETKQDIHFQEDLAAALMQDIAPVSLSSDFMDTVLASLPKRLDSQNDNLRAAGMAPESLRRLLGHGIRDIKWKSLIPGVAVHDVMGNRRYQTGERLYLLRAKGGMKMPEHSHHGEEWSLLLSGSYSVDGEIYARGDLHIEDETETHAPHINEGEDCICLVMTEGPLVMKSFIPKLVQKVVGI
jgi:putative transcriptional regulator